MLISPKDAQEIARLLRMLEPEPRAGVADNSDKEAGSPGRRAELLIRAEAMIRERHRRARFFSPSMFGEPAWDMLLAIYVMQGHRLNVAKLVTLVDLPQTTALRWLSYLEEKGFVGRSSDPDDRRLVCVHLTDQGLRQLDSYFGAILESPSPLI